MRFDDRCAERKRILAAFPNKHLKQHTREDMDGYLEQVGRLDGIADWQFVQTIKAIQNLLETAKVPAAEVDWEFWRASARTASGMLSKTWPCVVRFRPVPRTKR